jgi:hypothetical protein
MAARTGPLSGEERRLLLTVARCAVIAQALARVSHLCHQIVSTQALGEPARQVPEAWADNLADSRVVFLSSNPSISEPAPGGSRDSSELYPELYPVAGSPLATQRCLRRPADAILGFHRSAARELTGDRADPAVKCLMTEVVHCKSKGETAVASGAPGCSRRYLDNILAISPARS